MFLSYSIVCDVRLFSGGREKKDELEIGDQFSHQIRVGLPPLTHLLPLLTLGERPSVSHLPFVHFFSLEKEKSVSFPSSLRTVGSGEKPEAEIAARKGRYAGETATERTEGERKQRRRPSGGHIFFPGCLSLFFYFFTPLWPPSFSVSKHEADNLDNLDF